MSESEQLILNAIEEREIELYKYQNDNVPKVNWKEKPMLDSPFTYWELTLDKEKIIIILCKTKLNSQEVSNLYSKIGTDDRVNIVGEMRFLKPILDGRKKHPKNPENIEVFDFEYWKCNLMKIWYQPKFEIISAEGKCKHSEYEIKDGNLYIKNNPEQVFKPLLQMPEKPIDDPVSRYFGHLATLGSVFKITANNGNILWKRITNTHSHEAACAK
tara:strand:+ start:1027 stop:1671 length:645 start_codon:yes stop_codon:yes gene_type:complete